MPSGASLRITLSPFSVSKALYQAVLKELKAVKMDTTMEVGSLFKEVFCSAFSSHEIEKCLFECFKRCTYSINSGPHLKIDDTTFEAEESRQDYMSVCMEVAKENLLPFLKGLLSEYQNGLKMMTEGFQK